MVSVGLASHPIAGGKYLKKTETELGNLSKPTYALIRDNSEEKGESFKSQFISWACFDTGLKVIGLAFNKINNGIQYFKGIPIDPTNVTTLANRFFTPNKVGFEVGLQALKQPNLLVKPLKVLERAVAKVVGEEGIAIVGSSFFQKTLKPLFKFSGMPILIAFECLSDISKITNEFKQSSIGGIKQLLKTGTKAVINATAFCAGDIAGSAIGSVIGGAIGSVIPIAGTALGAQAGGWIGSMVGGCAASYFSNKFISSKINPEDKEQTSSDETFKSFTNKKLYA
jgi:hypothetical protein